MVYSRRPQFCKLLVRSQEPEDLGKAQTQSITGCPRSYGHIRSSLVTHLSWKGFAISDNKQACNKCYFEAHMHRTLQINSTQRCMCIQFSFYFLCLTIKQTSSSLESRFIYRGAYHIWHILDAQSLGVAIEMDLPLRKEGLPPGKSQSFQPETKPSSDIPLLPTLPP